MSFEEEFDKIIRQKAEEAKYPFEESNWEKTSRMLDVERQAARALKFKKIYLPGILAVVVGTVGLLAYSYMGDAGTTGSALALNTSSNTISQAADQTPANELKITNSHVAASAPATEVKNEEVTAPVSPTEKNGSSASPLTAAIPTLKKENTPSSQTARENSLPGSKGNAMEQETPAIPESGSLVKEVGTGKISPTKDPQNTSASEESSLPENAAITAKNAGSEYPENSSFATINLETSATESSQLKVDFLTGINLDLPFQLTDPELMPTPFNFLNRYDEDYYNKGKQKTHYLNAELGGTYLMGWNTGKGTDGQGMNYFGGFNYGLYLSKKISVGLGIQAYNISHIKQPFYSTKRKEYDFGSTSIYTVVTSNDLYYVSVPLKLNYSLNSSNMIGFGINAGYLLGAKNTVETFSDNKEKPADGPVTTKGIYENTRMGNIMLTAHYNARVCKRVALNAEFVYSTTDIFNNVGVVKSTEKPVGFRLSLQYTLFDK
jgi:hypothetical protein